MLSEEEIIKQINNIIYDLNAVNEDWYNEDEIETAKYQVKYTQGLLDLYNKQKEEIERLKNAEEYAKLGKETLLDTIHKQQKEIEQLANGIRVLGTNPDITTAEIIKEFTEKPITEEYMKEFKSRYISEDKIREVLEKERKKQKERVDISLALHSQYISLIDKIKKQLLEE